MIFSWYLNILVNLIVNKHLKYYDISCLMHIFDNNTDTIHLTNMPSMKIKNVDYFHLDRRQLCKNFLLQCQDAASAFDQVENVIKIQSYGMYNNRKYVIIIDNQEAFEEFFNSTSLTFVRDILVVYVLNNFEYLDRKNKFILFDNSLEVRLYTHKYIGIDGNNDPILLDVWFSGNQSFKFGNHLFPDKVSNQQGRELRAPCMNLLPYAGCTLDEEIGNEHNIILKYAKRFNFTLNIYPNTSDYYGYIAFNWTSDGTLGGLVKDGRDEYNDIIYGGFPSPYHTDTVRSVIYNYEVSVPIPKIKYGWFMFLEVFKVYTWLLIIVLFICARFLVYLHKKLRTFIKSDENLKTTEIKNISLYGLFINQPSAITQDVKNSMFLKYIIILLLYSSVLIVTAYSSRLSSVMVAPVYENNINTLEECANSNLKLLFFDEYYGILLSDTRQVYKKLVDKIYDIPNNTDSVLSEELLSSGKYAVARYRRSTGGYFEFEFHLKQMDGRYKTITPELFTDEYSILLRKNSMHTVEIRKLVTTAVEAGLMDFWEEDALRLLNQSTFQQKLQDHKFETINNNLNLQHLKGCFGFWMCAMGVSILVFFIEVYTKHRIQFKTTSTIEFNN